MGQEERHYEVIPRKVIDAQGRQSRFAFARNSPTVASDAFKHALAVAGVTADTPATMLSDGDAGLWRLQRASLPNATVVLDWWHATVRFEHALQAFADWSGRSGDCGTGVGPSPFPWGAIQRLDRRWRSTLLSNASAIRPAS